VSQTLTRKHKPAALRAAVRSHNRNGSSLGLSAERTHDLIRKVQAGLPFKSLETLSHKSGIPETELAAILGIPHRTFARRKSSGRFAPDESERLLRIARIFEQAVELFEGDIPSAVAWLRSPRNALGSYPPLEYSSTELGAREVENLIGQLQHGIFP
jgi:putative toxin-antitoxin system antitoxin component (TIGR02293 family)